LTGVAGLGRRWWKMQYTTLNGTDLRVSRIAFGCMSTVGSQTYSGLEEAEAVKTIHVAMDSGVTLFDTARAYADGESERLLGKAIKGRRDDVVVASKPKGATLAKDELLAECDQSLSDLGIDTIDLYQIHWPKHQVAWEETADAMLRMKEAGKIRHIGVCNFGVEDMTSWLDVAPAATNQIAYNMLYRATEFEVSPLLEKHGVGILCYSPLAQGLLAGRFDSADSVPTGRARTRHFSGDREEARHGEAGCEDATFKAIAEIKAVAEEQNLPMGGMALAWLLSRPCVTSVLVGASRPDQVQRNVEAADIELSAETIARLDAASEPVKAALGPSLDMWASPPRMR